MDARQHWVIGKRYAKTPVPTNPIARTAILPDSSMSPTELQMLAIFRDLFHTDAVDLTSDFYELGGDSTMGVTLGLILEDEFRVEVPLDLLEEVTTVRAMAEWIDSVRQGSPAA
jgi:acyl carrier protein